MKKPNKDFSLCLGLISVFAGTFLYVFGLCCLFQASLFVGSLLFVGWLIGCIHFWGWKKMYEKQDMNNEDV